MSERDDELEVSGAGVDDLDLNDLERFTKHRSPRLVREAYSHCEVPAGCGGVVLRWVSPDEGVPVEFIFYTPARLVEATLDGVEIRRARVKARPGRSVLALVFEGVPPSGALLMAVLSNVDVHSLPRRWADDPQIEVMSAPGAWRWMDEAPPGGWRQRGFDDGGWRRLEAVEVPSPGGRAPGGWQHRRCEERGAVGLGVTTPLAGERIWVRATLTMIEEG